jgi:protein phosphatase
MNTDDILSSLFQVFTDPSLKLQDKLSSVSIYYLLDQTSKTLQNENIILKLSSSIHIVGDIHGNLDDLLRIFETFGLYCFQIIYF